MNNRSRPADRMPMVQPGQLAVLYSAEAFILCDGHPLRAANCLVCQRVIGGQYASIVGVAGLGGTACSCGAVISDSFVLHANHLPVSRTILQRALSRGLRCQYQHDPSE